MDLKTKFLELVELIKKIGLNSQDFEKAMLLGQLYGKVLYSNHSGIYRDDDFEKLLISWYIKSNPPFSIETYPVGELHILSEPLSTGGHTRLLERLIELRECGDVLISRPLNSLDGKLRLSTSSKIHSSQAGFALDELIVKISAYETVFLHIHPDDLLTAVAVGVVKRRARNKVILVNHADHVFSFGFSSADFIAEVSEYGFYLSQSRRSARSSYLGIPVAITERPILFAQKKALVSIFSAGSEVKYKPQGKNSFPSIAGNILNAIPTSTVTVIGPNLLFNWWWWRAKLRNPRRLKIHKNLPYERYLLSIGKADIYIDSFPMTGGTALPEIRSRGIPVTGVLSGSSGYTPLDATKFLDASELIYELKRYCQDGGVILERNNSKEILSLTKYTHHPDEIRVRLNKMLSGIMVDPPGGIKKFDVDFYERNWVKCNSINLGQDAFDLMTSAVLSANEKSKLVLCSLRLTGACKLPVYIIRSLRALLSGGIASKNTSAEQ